MIPQFGPVLKIEFQTLYPTFSLIPVTVFSLSVLEMTLVNYLQLSEWIYVESEG